MRPLGILNVIVFGNVTVIWGLNETLSVLFVCSKIVSAFSGHLCKNTWALPHVL